MSHNRHIMRGFMAAIVALLLAPGTILAQGFQGTLRGEVQDETGAVVPDIRVVMTNQNTGETRSQLSSSAGTFEFSNLLVSSYNLKVEASGFKSYVRGNIAVGANQVAEVIVRLELGPVASVVEVFDGAELVQTTTAQLLGANFRRETTELPNPDRDGSALNLAILAPGTTTQPGGVVGIGGSIGGNRPRNNNFVVDGLDNNDPSSTGNFSPVIQDAVEEFTLLTNQFAAEHGHSTAGQFVTVTKSGTNEIHGRGWWNIQNRNLNSLDNITRSTTAAGDPKPRLDFNRLGAQVGGPIIEDRWFTFGSYEYRNLSQAGAASGQILVPTAAGLATLQNLAGTAGTGISPVSVGILANQVPVASVATSSADVLNEATGLPVAVPLGTFSATTPQFDRAHLFMVSQDYHAGLHRLSGRFSFSRERSIEAGSLPVEQFNSNRSLDTRRFTFSDVFAPKPTLVNELRLAYLRSVDDIPVSLPAAPGNTDIFGNYNINAQSLLIGPQGNFPQTDFTNIYQVVNQTSWIRAGHTFKWGIDTRSIIGSRDFLNRARGEFTYTDLDEFVRDQFPSVVSSRGVGQGTFTQSRPAVFWFFQDSWKLHPRFNLELGLRYEWTGTPRDARLQSMNSFASIPSLSDDPVFATLTPAHQAALLGHLGNRVIFRAPNSDTNNWAPRLGLAWDLFGDGKTSLRAGMGIAHDVIYSNLALLQMPPQVQGVNQESNACLLTPSPQWCGLVPAGTSPLDADIRASTTGFLAGGGLLPTQPNDTRQNAALARAFTGFLVLDDRVPETYNWSLSLQRQLSPTLLLEGRYVGNHAINLPVQRWGSAGVPNPHSLPVFLTPSEALSANFAGQSTLDDFLGARGLLLQPYGIFSPLTMFTFDGQSWYHGASAVVSKRMSSGFQFNGSYTFSRTIDVGENDLFTSFVNPRRPFNHLDIFANKGLSALHRQHKFVVSWLYDLPHYTGGQRFLNGAMNGWQLNGSFLAETGQPVSAISFRDLNGDFDTAGDSAILNLNGRPNTGTDVDVVCFSGGAPTISASAAGCGGSSGVVGYVAQDSSAQYIRGGLGSDANVGRGTIFGPGINTWNLGIFKETPIDGEQGRYIQFRVEMFNAFNHPSYNFGSGGVNYLVPRAVGFPGYVTPGTSQFLDRTILSGGLGQAPFQRVVQLGLKFIF